MQTRSAAKETQIFKMDDGVTAIVSPSATGKGRHTRWTYDEAMIESSPIRSAFATTSDTPHLSFSSDASSSDNDSLFDGPLTPLSSMSSFHSEPSHSIKSPELQVAIAPTGPRLQYLGPGSMRQTFSSTLDTHERKIAREKKQIQDDEEIRKKFLQRLRDEKEARDKLDEGLDDNDDSDDFEMIDDPELERYFAAEECSSFPPMAQTPLRRSDTEIISESPAQSQPLRRQTYTSGPFPYPQEWIQQRSTQLQRYATEEEILGPQ